MKKTFWDVKARKKVDAEVTDCVKFENGRYAFKGATKDGRSLTVFVKAAEAEAYLKGCKKCKK